MFGPTSSQYLTRLFQVQCGLGNLGRFEQYRTEMLMQFQHCKSQNLTLCSVPTANTKHPFFPHLKYYIFCCLLLFSTDNNEVKYSCTIIIRIGDAVASHHAAQRSQKLSVPLVLRLLTLRALNPN